jgi:hypothetical protein
MDKRKCNHCCCCSCRLLLGDKKKVSEPIVKSSTNSSTNSSMNSSTTTGSNLPLGLRNNNPLNIRISSNAWQGKIASPNGFENFSTLEYGIRAGVKNLQTYYTKYNLMTVTTIISKWAPPTENHTQNYINYVASALGVSPTAVISYTTDTFSKLVAAMSEVELGKQYGISVSKVKGVISQFGLF